MYEITDYSKNQAKKYNVKIKPSTTKNKKIDVFKDNKKIASVGHIDYLDYGKYLEIDRNLANDRRRLYKIRHKKDLNSTNGKWANRLLW